MIFTCARYPTLHLFTKVGWAHFQDGKFETDDKDLQQAIIDTNDDNITLEQPVETKPVKETKRGK